MGWIEIRTREVGEIWGLLRDTGKSKQVIWIPVTTGIQETHYQTFVCYFYLSCK